MTDDREWVPWDGTEMVHIPYSTNPYNLLVPGLWMGGHYYQDASSGGFEKSDVPDGIDHVVCLHCAPWVSDCAPPGVLFQGCAIPDGPLSDAQLAQVRFVAIEVLKTLHQDRTVLVRCKAGLNRSGLLAAFVLLRLRFLADEAIDLIRERRGPYALCNRAFIGYIHDEETRSRAETQSRTL